MKRYNGTPGTTHLHARARVRVYAHTQRSERTDYIDNIILLFNINNLTQHITGTITGTVLERAFRFFTRRPRPIPLKAALTHCFLNKKGTVKIKNIYGSAQRGGFLAGGFPIWVNIHADSDPLKLLQGKGFRA
jgi:hypothetical protein